MMLYEDHVLELKQRTSELKKEKVEQMACKTSFSQHKKVCAIEDLVRIMSGLHLKYEDMLYPQQLPL